MEITPSVATARGECGRATRRSALEEHDVVEPTPGDLLKESSSPTGEARVPRLRARPTRAAGPTPEPGLTVAYLARHGQTESNLLRRYAGYSPETLTAMGRGQIGGLAAQLGLAGIAEIWTSEVARARESAELVGSVLSIPVRADARLNEMRMGPWEGLTEQQVAEQFPDAYAVWCTVPDRLALEGRESLAVLATRVRAVVNDAVRQPHPVLLMTHVAPMRVAVLCALGLPLRLYKRVHVANGDCVHVDQVQGEAHRLGEGRSLRERLALSLRGPESSVA